MIVVVDYGVGNIGAIVNMLDYLGVASVAGETPAAIGRATKLILPGVGAFDRAMSMLEERQLVGPLGEAVRRGTPVLGVCLGMQLLGRRSEEGTRPGLGWIAADTVRIRPPEGSGLKVPHMGWSEVQPARPSPIFPESNTGERFYFVHSYHVVCDDPQDVAATVEYGGRLCCAVSRGNVHGAQFHPEKSHRYGMRLLRDFAERA
jgi:glutamine amidotransferase